MKSISIPLTFVVCAGFSALHILVLNWMGVETLGKGKYQIEKEFNGRNYSIISDAKQSELGIPLKDNPAA